MKKILISLSLILSLSSCQNSLFSKSSNDESATIVARFKGGNITLKDVNDEIAKLVAQNEKLENLEFNQLGADQKEAIIKTIVLKRVSYKEAKKRDLDDDKDYQDALRIFKTELLKQKLFIAIAEEAAEEENLKKNYDELVIKMKDKKDIRVSYIAVKTKKGAKYLHRILTKRPKNFAKTAKKKSLDSETSKKGGDLGFVIEDALPAEIVAELRSIPKGKLSTPTLIGDKWIIAKMTDERPAEIASFKDSKNALAQSLSKKAVEDFTIKSLKGAEISITVE